MTIEEIKNTIMPDEKKQVAEATGYSISTVTMVLNGQRSNNVIIAACEDIIKMRKEGLGILTKKYNRYNEEREGVEL